MRLIEAQQKLISLGVPILETADAAACLNISLLHASQLLSRLAKAKIFIKLTKGKWAIRNIDPFILPEYITTPYPTYISLQSALYHHGLISQIPIVVYAISLARTKRYKTSLASVSIHHINPELFCGFDVVPKTDIKMAEPEKALMDILYLHASKSLLFRSLPEIEIPRNFNKKKFLSYAEKIKSKQKRAFVLKKFKKIMNQ